MFYRIGHLKKGQLIWKTTPLRSLNNVIEWLRIHQFNENYIVVEARNKEELNLKTTAKIPIREFLAKIHKESLLKTTDTESEEPTILKIDEQETKETDFESLLERAVRVLDIRRLQIEEGPGGDHNQPYRFLVPSVQVLLAWGGLIRKRLQRSDPEDL